MKGVSGSGRDAEAVAAFLLDSDIIIDALNHRRGRRELLRDLTLQNHVLGCCSVNVTEVCSGMLPAEEGRTGQLLAGLVCYEVTRPIAWQAGLWRREYLRRGRTLSLADVTIAAVALAHGLTLVTNNVKDYPMPDIRLLVPPANN